MTESCPRCGAAVDGEKCPQCGVLVALYRASLEKLRRGPVAPAASTSPATGLRPPEPPTAPETAGVRRLVFHGTAGSLFGIQAVNVLFTLLTLGVYYFWGKARVRAYLLGASELEGDRLAYHGTGAELLIGFLKGLVVFVVPIALLTIVPQLYGVPDAVTSALSMLVYLLGLLLVPLAMVGARRYRLSRSSWRGVRFSFRGSAREFVGIFVVGTILTSLTLGVYYPVFVTRRQAFMISHSYFGSHKFDFDGDGRELIGPFLVMLLLFLPTLGLSWFWFSARRTRFFTGHTRFGATRFRSTVTGGRLAWLTISNVLAIVGTLGLAWPWTVVRSVRFTFRYLTLEGPFDLADVRQDAQAASATGEGLAGLLDADFGVS
jgi:uncharacterized membrane protein YjgN (DUF898 family)